MSVKHIIDEIMNLTSSLDLTDTEEERLTNELSFVSERLRSRDYQLNSFSGSTHNPRERTRDAYTELEYYSFFGRGWQVIFDLIGVGRDKTVLDLCPGFVPKVELGLFYSGFKGKVQLLNIDEESLHELEKLLLLFNPAFQREFVICDLFSPDIPTAKIVTGNHIFDDLLIHNYLDKKSIDSADFYKDESMVKSVWQNIISEGKAGREELTLKLVEAFKRAVLPSGVLAITQYQSYMERVMELNEVTPFCVEMLRDTASLLVADGFVEFTDKIKGKLPEECPFSDEECVLLRCWA